MWYYSSFNPIKTGPTIHTWDHNLSHNVVVNCDEGWKYVHTPYIRNLGFNNGSYDPYGPSLESAYMHFHHLKLHNIKCNSRCCNGVRVMQDTELVINSQDFQETRQLGYHLLSVANRKLLYFFCAQLRIEWGRSRTISWPWIMIAQVTRLWFVCLLSSSRKAVFQRFGEHHQCCEEGGEGCCCTFSRAAFKAAMHPSCLLPVACCCCLAVAAAAAAWPGRTKGSHHQPRF